MEFSRRMEYHDGIWNITDYHENQDVANGYESFEIHNSLGGQEQDLSTTPFPLRHAIGKTLTNLKDKRERWKQQLEIQRSKIYN